MIKGITQSGKYITVSGTQSSTYVNNYSGAQGVGNMRYNTSNQNIEVFDGNNWVTLNMAYPSVGLTNDAESLLDWAREERSKQWSRKAAVDKNPALRKAYEAIQRAEENFDLLEAIAREHDSSNESETQASP